jgi:hypothetical protein
MPPRYAYWTILIGEEPTAFRASAMEDIMPTFNRLKEKQPTAVLKWFQNGKLWTSRIEAREAMASRGDKGRRADPRHQPGIGGGAGWRGKPAIADGVTKPEWKPKSDVRPEWKPKGKPFSAGAKPDWKPKSKNFASSAKPDWQPKGKAAWKPKGKSLAGGAKPEWKPRDEGGKPAWKPKSEGFSSNAKPEWKPKSPARPDWKPRGDGPKPAWKPKAAHAPSGSSPQAPSREQRSKPEWKPRVSARPADAPTGRPDPRDKKWRPGGDHKDPRQKYKDAKKAKWTRFKQAIRARTGHKKKTDG